MANKRKYVKRTKEQDLAIAKQRAQGSSIKSLAKQFDRTEKTIRKILKDTEHVIPVEEMEEMITEEILKDSKAVSEFAKQINVKGMAFLNQMVDEITDPKNPRRNQLDTLIRIMTMAHNHQRFTLENAIKLRTHKEKLILERSKLDDNNDNNDELLELMDDIVNFGKTEQPLVIDVEVEETDET